MNFSCTKECEGRRTRKGQGVLALAHYSSVDEFLYARWTFSQSCDTTSASSARTVSRPEPQLTMSLPEVSLSQLPAT